MAGKKAFRIYDPGNPEAKDRLRALNIRRLDHPSRYEPNEGLIDAVNVAIRLGRPLLVTGEPGTGKTQLAYSIAYNLGVGPLNDKEDPPYHVPYRFTAQHNSLAQDLFYRYDSLKHFSDANLQKSQGQEVKPISREAIEENYIIYGALGKAIKFAQEYAQRSVVLIDEIDKAPREFPNDLLEALEDFRFSVKEIQGKGEAPYQAPQDLKPIVIITSNREKMLPEAFLRRCIYYHIYFPEPEKIRSIVINRLYGGELDPQHGLRFSGQELDFLLQHFQEVREICRRKKPSTSELLGWLQILDAYESFMPTTQGESRALTGPLAPSDLDILRMSYTVLAKHESDLQILEQQFLSSPVDPATDTAS